MHVNSDVRLVRVRSGRQYKKQPFEFDSIFFLLSFADLLVRTESLFLLRKPIQVLAIITSFGL